jgi:hypothetical protein
MRALAGLFAVVLAFGILACGGAGTPPVQVAPTAAPPASGSPAAPAASPAGTTDPNSQDEYDYDY